jgi:hypothetical protein
MRRLGCAMWLVVCEQPAMLMHHQPHCTAQAYTQLALVTHPITPHYYVLHSHHSLRQALNPTA